MTRISQERLKYIRNQIPVRQVAESLCGCECKEVEGLLRFVCPVCFEMRTSFHPRENLGRCFRCARNFNPLDFVLVTLGLNFRSGVEYLEKQLKSGVFD